MQRLLEKINAHPRATLIVAGTTVFGAVAVVILLMFLSLRDSVVNPVVSPEEEKMVLSEVIKNNASGLINNNQNTTTVPNTGNTPIPIPAEPTPNGLGNSNPNASQPEVPVAPDINEYNYRVTRTTKQVGPAYSACKMYGYGYGGYGPGYPGEGSDVDNVSEYYEYFERYLTIYKQQVTEDGKLTLFNINKYGKSVNSSTYYLEGDYAVENIFKSYSQFDNQQDTQTISYPNWSLDEYVSNYFGKDAAIIEVKTDSNGVKHYLIRSTYTSYCDPSYDPYLVSDEIVPPVQRTIINIYSVNGKTFSIEQIKKYIDSVKDENLIDVTTTEINRSKVNYSQVNAQFTINSSVQLIKNDYSNLVYNYNPINRINTALDFLSESDSHILLPSEKDGLGYLWVNGFEPNDYVDTMQFYKDRDFFPSNAWGDTLFDRYNSHLNYNSKFDYTVSLSMGTDKGYSISAYKQDVVMDDIIAEIMATRSTSK